MTTFQILLTVLVTAAVSFWAGVKFTGNQTNCPAPTNLQVTKDNARLEVNLSWAASASASAYLILVSDAADVNTIIESQISQTNTLTLRNLPAGKSYVVSVYSKCDNGATGEVNPVPVQESFNTNDWIIIVDDIVHLKEPNGSGSRMNDTICPKIGTCNSVSPTNDRYVWTSTNPEEVFSIEIARADAPNVALARGLIIKKIENNTIRVNSHISVECANTGFRTINEPREAFCFPQPTQNLCGNFTDAATGIPYMVQCDLLGFKVVFPNGNNANTYVVTVKKCVPLSNPD